MIRLTSCAILLLAFAASLPGADCLTVRGDKIFAEDLARGLPVFSGIEPGTVIGYSPNPGTKRTFTAGHLTRLLRQHGAHATATEGICFERVSEKLDAERIEEAMLGVLPYPEATIEVVDFSKHAVPEGKLQFRMSGLQSPPRATPETAVVWRGVVQYGDRRTAQVWARVRLSVERRQVVAARPIQAGTEFTAEDLTIQSVQVFPTAAQPIDDISMARGARSRRTLQVGEAVHADAIIATNDVERGEIVTVEVLSGAARLRFEGKAETSGQRGKRVYVRNPESGKRFLATVTARGKVTVRPMSGDGSL
jgi:flagella basal body P-ring formation protein FlgA